MLAAKLFCKHKDFKASPKDKQTPSKLIEAVRFYEGGLVIEDICRVLIKATATHLDAVQGSKEERASRMEEYGERTTDAGDTAMRQESAGMPGYARQQGGRCVGMVSGGGRLG